MTVEDWLVWLILAVLFGIGEIATVGFFLGPFAVGAAVAAVISAAGVGLVPSLAVFLLVSILLLLALRPQQWVKNVFVFAALVFARGERGGWVDGDYSDLRRTFFAFLAFCLGSSAVYLVNDVADV